jgi:hypothetical protein
MSASGIDPITNALQDLPESERKMIEKFVMSLRDDHIKPKA